MARPKSGNGDAAPRYILTPENYDGVVSALVGNGELCTTLGPTGYHTPPDQKTDIAHRTQHFVLAGRRMPDPQHPLMNFGTLVQRIIVDGKEVVPEDWEQEISSRDSDGERYFGVDSITFWPRLVSTFAY